MACLASQINTAVIKTVQHLPSRAHCPSWHAGAGGSAGCRHAARYVRDSHAQHEACELRLSCGSGDLASLAAPATSVETSDRQLVVTAYSSASFEPETLATAACCRSTPCTGFIPSQHIDASVQTRHARQLVEHNRSTLSYAVSFIIIIYSTTIVCDYIPLRSSKHIVKLLSGSSSQC